MEISKYIYRVDASSYDVANKKWSIVLSNQHGIRIVNPDHIIACDKSNISEQNQLAKITEFLRYVNTEVADGRVFTIVDLNALVRAVSAYLSKQEVLKLYAPKLKEYGVYEKCADFMKGKIPLDELLQ